MTGWLTGLWNWVDARLPVQRAWDTHMGKYYAPKNFNFWYFFGVLSLLILVNQLLTGIWLTMNYVPSAEGAFASVEYIMRDVPYGWLIRYLHSTGASAFFVVVYLHMFRGLMYGSYRAPRELVWIFGMLIYVALMAEAFLGYVLPWGQMSYWGAQVIVNLFSAIPFVGDALVEWIRGDYLISGATLNRFFALHVVAVPIALLGLVVMHILALHEVGSNNPDGVDIKKHKDENGIPLDGVRFHPYYTVHDIVGITVFLFVFMGIVFFAPEMNGMFLEYANFEEANNLKTPAHIAPVWYFTPFYAILRAVTIELGGVFTAKLLGFMAMGAAIVILFFLPWLDKAKARSIRYKGWLPKVMLILFASNFVILGKLGLDSPSNDKTLLSQISTVFYFVFFLCMPTWTNAGKKSFVGIVLSVVLGLQILYLTFVSNLGLFAALGAEEAHPNWILYLFGLALGVLTVALPWLAAADSESPVPDRVRMKGLNKALVWGALIAFLLLAFVPLKAVAAGGGGCGDIPCEHFEKDLSDKASLQRGSKYFVNYCMGCHTAGYSRYERVADDLEIPHQLVLDNLIFDDTKIGSLMNNAMAPNDSKVWFGVTPPDLTLMTRAKSSDYVYTFLKSYYKDDARPTGVNNKAFPNVGMPHVLLEMQGLQECAAGPKLYHGKTVRDALGEPVLTDCGSLKVGSVEGSMNPEEFDQAAHDIVNFMAYMAEPIADERQRIGYFVFLFLTVLLVFAVLLNREYWKDIH